MACDHCGAAKTFPPCCVPTFLQHESRLTPPPDFKIDTPEIFRINMRTDDDA